MGKALAIRSKTSQGCPLLSFLFNILQEVLTRAIGQDKEIKGIQIEKEEVILLYLEIMLLYRKKNTKDSTKYH